MQVIIHSSTPSESLLEKIRLLAQSSTVQDSGPATPAVDLEVGGMNQDDTIPHLPRMFRLQTLTAVPEATVIPIIRTISR